MSTTDREYIVLKWPMTSASMEWFMQPGPVLSVAWQHGAPTLWIQHEVDSGKLTRSFVAIPTGEVFPGAVHVGSAVSDDLVFHVYETTGMPPLIARQDRPRQQEAHR